MTPDYLVFRDRKKRVYMIPDLKLGGAPLSKTTTVEYISRGLGILSEWVPEGEQQRVGK